MKFFKKNGEELTKDEFIKQYSESYYLDTPKLVDGITKNSKYVEKNIDDLLKNGIKKDTDVIHILAWKLGKIKHRESDENNTFVYHSDWENAESFEVKRYSKEFKVKKLVDYIVSNINTLEKLSDENSQEVLNLLRENSPSGIGTVYLITLLYFISKGKSPIYDRFAMKALDAICSETKPNNVVRYVELPCKSSKKFESIMTEHMAKYIEKMEKVFGKEYQNNRNIDRALWVYGHLFPDKTNNKR